MEQQLGEVVEEQNDGQERGDEQCSNDHSHGECRAGSLVPAVAVRMRAVHGASFHPVRRVGRGLNSEADTPDSGFILDTMGDCIQEVYEGRGEAFLQVHALS